MSFKVGDRVKTTDKCMTANLTQYHNVPGVITAIRSDTCLPILFRPDVSVPADPGEWALFEDEIVAVAEVEEYWKKKYHALKSVVDSFRYDTEGM